MNGSLHLDADLYFWISGIKYHAPTEADARKLHHRHLAQKRKKLKLQLKQAQERQAQENAKFKGLSFLEGFKLGAAELAEQWAQDTERLKHNWGKDYCIYTNPDQLCCFCGTSIPTQRIWFFDTQIKSVLAVIGLDGKAISKEHWHPHVNGTKICIGDNTSVDGARALFLGLNPSSAYKDVKWWLSSELNHKCWWDSQLPHYPDTYYSPARECGCRQCRYCQLPLCECVGNLLSHNYLITHPIRPITQAAFAELVKWAESMREAYNWDEKTTIFNANYIASLSVESPLLPTSIPTNEESAQGGKVNEHGTTTNTEYDNVVF